IEAGVVGTNGFVDMPGESQLEKRFSLSEMEEIVNTGHYLALRYRLNTKPDGTPVKLFADYQIKAKLVGEFIYRVTSN
ncbi:MAG: hypothetical protein KDD63_25515, partial [Bacteroidetes bacterium]|nr:hypothetical protein [Bacteroidota bacterium]